MNKYLQNLVLIYDKQFFACSSVSKHPIDKKVSEHISFGFAMIILGILEKGGLKVKALAGLFQSFDQFIIIMPPAILAVGNNSVDSLNVIKDFISWFL